MYDLQEDENSKESNDFKNLDQKMIENLSIDFEEKKEELDDEKYANVFSSDGWRGIEKPMFNLEHEKDAYRKIVDELTEEEKDGLSDVNMPIRHFRAEKGDIKKAIAKLKSTIKWRKNFEVEAIKKCTSEGGDPDLCKMMLFENETGKIYARGYDKNGRGLLYLRPGLENSRNGNDNMKHLVYQIERGIACTERKSGLSKYVVIVDFTGYSMMSAPPMSTTKMTVEILQDRYPERLFRFYICNPPTLFRVLWKMISPFIDPVTKEKIKFCHGKEGLETLAKDFDLDTLEKCIVGTTDLRPFDFKEYLLETPFDYTFDEKP